MASNIKSWDGLGNGEIISAKRKSKGNDKPKSAFWFLLLLLKIEISG